VNQDVVLDIALPATLFLMMLSMGANLTLADFRLLAGRPSAVFVGVAAQMVLLPLVAFGVLLVLGVPPAIFAGFMILALSPGGTTSNVFSYLAGGNLALSVVLTGLVSLVTPLSLPLIAGWMLSSQLTGETAVAMPFVETVLKLVTVTLLPMALGMLLRRRRPAFCLRNEFWMTRIPFLMLMGVIAGIIHQNWERMPVFLEAAAVPALLLASLALVMGYGFARFTAQRRREARTIAIETSIQNGGTAILVTGTILRSPEMTIAPVMYGILMLLPVFACLAWLYLNDRLRAGTDQNPAG